MTPAGEMVRTALLALLVGVTIPLLVQLFLVLRSVRLATDGVERRLEKILADVDALAEQVKARAAAPSPLGAMLTATVPAVVAGIQAFRTSLHHDTAEATGADNGVTREPETKEKGHEQRKA
jgi:hypothetical protein